MPGFRSPALPRGTIGQGGLRLGNQHSPRRVLRGSGSARGPAARLVEPGDFERQAARGRQFCRARAAALFAIAFSISGCNLDSNFSELGEKLLDPDVTGLDAPGQRLLAGPHFDLSIQADAAGARYALARNEESELTIIDFAERTHCRAGRVVRYGNAVSAPRTSALIPLLVVDEAETAWLAFSDFACGRSSFQVPAGGLPVEVVSELPWGSGTALLIRTPEQGLALVDPWSEEVRPLAGAVRSSDPLSAFGHYLWVDGGAIVISDAALEPVARYGQRVAEFSLSPQDGELAYVDLAGAGAASGTLFRARATDAGNAEEIAADVCGVRYLTLGERRMLAYLSPCADRRLVLRDRADDSTRVLAEQVASAPAVHNLRGEWALTYVTAAPGESSPIGTLWLARGDAEPIAIAENARTSPSAVTADGGLLTLVDWSNTGGRLVQWKPDALTDVAERVAEIAPVGRFENNDLTLLANYDGATGELVRLHRDLSTEVLATGVPTRAASQDAFLANFDGSQGELRWLNRRDGSSEVLGTGVARGAFRFAQQFRAILMLTEREAQTNTSTLEVRLLDSGQTYTLNTGVTEAREVAFPSPGLLYNVVAGERAGVWFSKTL